jgi:membrane-bound lytic murein transglycosylase D
MLKRKLSKVSLLSLCILLMAAANRGNSMVSPVDELNNEPSWLHDTLSRKPHAFDSLGICNCLGEIHKIKFENAPRIQLHHSMKTFVTDYMTKNGKMLGTLKQKNGHYFKTIEQVFTKQGLPAELKYLAVIESKLKTTAVSRVGATGMWQFMPATAKIYGLKITSRVDERKYSYKSTVAAARYMERLYELFDDWLLVIAAYNCGPGNVYKAIRLSGSRNFWKMQYFLPKETRMHVKKFIATHYYYEGQGSHVTLTKAEREKHLLETEEFIAMQEGYKIPTDATDMGPGYFNWLAIIKDEQGFVVVAKK